MPSAFTSLVTAKRAELEQANRRRLSAAARRLLISAFPQTLRERLVEEIGRQLKTGELRTLFDAHLEDARKHDVTGEEVTTAAVSAMLLEFVKFSCEIAGTLVENEAREEQFQAGRAAELERILIELESRLDDSAGA